MDIQFASCILFYFGWTKYHIFIPFILFVQNGCLPKPEYKFRANMLHVDHTFWNRVAILIKIVYWNIWCRSASRTHYNDIIMSAMASQITNLTIVHSSVYSGAEKNQSSASLAFVRGIHRWPVNSPHKGPVTRQMFPFGDVIMLVCHSSLSAP